MTPFSLFLTPKNSDCHLCMHLLLLNHNGRVKVKRLLIKQVVGYILPKGALLLTSLGPSTFWDAYIISPSDSDFPGKRPKLRAALLENPSQDLLKKKKSCSEKSGSPKQVPEYLLPPHYLTARPKPSFNFSFLTP